MLGGNSFPDLVEGLLVVLLEVQQVVDQGVALVHLVDGAFELHIFVLVVVVVIELVVILNVIFPHQLALKQELAGGDAVAPLYIVIFIVALGVLLLLQLFDPLLRLVGKVAHYIVEFGEEPSDGLGNLTVELTPEAL